MRNRIIVPYLEVREQRRKKSGKTVQYWYWRPRKVDCDKYGVKPQALAKNPPAGTTAREIRAIAIQEAMRLNERLALRRSGVKHAPAEERDGTLPWLFSQWKSSVAWEALSEKTRMGTYECWMPVLEKWSAINGHPDVRELTTPIVFRLYEELAAPDPDTGERAYARAKNIIATLRASLSFAVRTLEGMPPNPATKLGIKSAPLREQLWTKDQVEQAANKAVVLGLPSIGLGIQIAYAMGQRRADIVSLRFEQWDGNDFIFRQQKTDARIRIPATATLRSLMAERFDRSSRDPKAYIITDAAGAPFSGDTFYNAFTKVTEAAGFTDLWFHDLRRTAVVRMARAGLTLPEICAVTGHVLRSASDIIKRYLPRDPEVAKAAINKLDLGG